MGNTSQNCQYFGFFNPKHPKYKAEMLTLCVTLYRRINKDRSKTVKRRILVCLYVFSNTTRCIKFRLPLLVKLRTSIDIKHIKEVTQLQYKYFL